MLRLVIGCMSGTSLDGIDAALVRIDGTGLTMRGALVDVASRPLGELGVALGEIASGGFASAERMGTLALRLGEAHVDVINDLLDGRGDGDTRPCFIAVHGQTVFHAPPISLQLMNPAPIARAFGVPVGYDFRAADLTAGGQGAPITPLADYVIFGRPDEHRTVVNLGGFINYTDIGCQTESPQRDIDSIRGGDLCACNQLLDAIARQGLNAPYDKDGQAASSGEPLGEVISSLCGLLGNQARAGRSLGTGDEFVDWVDHALVSHEAPDLARSSCVAIAKTLTPHVNPKSRLILAGGGAKNPVLVESIKQHFPGKLSLSETLGGVASVGVEYREAMGMGVLGALSRDGVPITLPQITGCTSPAPLAGSWIEA